MKKVIPYLLALILGYLIANLIFDYQNIKMTGFQLGVYKDVTLAKEYLLITLQEMDQIPISLLR